MNPNTLHETAITDILSTLKNGIASMDGKSLHRSRTSISKYSSITKAASDLTLVTPVLCSTAVNIQYGSMVSKAIERRNIAMYQMLFSAFNISNDKDALSYLKQFHTNLDIDKLTVDKFISTMDGLHESVNYSYISPTTISAITEACVKNLYVTFDSDVNESSLMDFKEVENYAGKDIIPVKEAHNWEAYPPYPIEDPDNRGVAIGPKKAQDLINMQNTSDARTKADRADYWANTNYNYRASKDIADTGYKARRDIKDDKYREDRTAADARQNNIKNNQTATQIARQSISTQLVQSDIKKANEMQPSLMIVNFYSTDENRALSIAQQFVCGVKSKLYSVDSDMIIDKIIKKNGDSDLLLNLVKVSTGEISFVKDFLFAIDAAKVDALAKSKRKSGAAAFKALEKRSLKSKIRKGLKSDNFYKTVATLVITKEESDQLNKYNNIDVENPKTIIPIMDDLSLMYFVIVDEVSESIQLLESGSYEYEIYSFDSLEKEGGDSNYKKIVNLMTKVSR